MGADKQGWLTLREASKQIGVSPGTLRVWADEGRVQTYRTPGGHRRFRVGETDAPVSGARRRADARWKLLEHSALGRVRLAVETGAASDSSLPSFAPRARAEYRDLGRALIQALVEGVHKENVDWERAVELGQAYGAVHRRFGVSLGQAVKGLGFFRMAFVESVVEFAFGLGEPGAEQLNAWLRRVNEMIDLVCLAMIESQVENQVTDGDQD